LPSGYETAPQQSVANVLRFLSRTLDSRRKSPDGRRTNQQTPARTPKARPGAKCDIPVKTSCVLAITLWLIAGLAMHAYFSLAVQEPAAVEQKRDLYLHQFENDDTVAPRIRQLHWRSNTMNAAAYAAWIAIGGLLAVSRIRSWYPKQEKSFDA
jgi:hypothetical protein